MAYKINPFTTNFDYYETGGSLSIDASGVTYDNISSGLSSTDVQGAIDELSVLVSGITETQDLSAVLTLGNSAGTNDINLNNNDILNADKIDFNLATTDTAGEGQLVWNSTDGTLNLGLKGGNVTLQIGQEQIVRVVNKTATNINLLESAYQVVRVTGAQGQRLKVDLALATTSVLSIGTLGIVTETINNNQEGFITTSGLVRGINTTGSLQSETWVDGDVLYLSGSIAGGITNIKPIAPIHEIRLGYVVNSNITQGSIFIKIEIGYLLDELNNVAITTPANGNFLEYNGSLWVNRGIVYTIELIDALTVDFYAPYDLKINTTTNIKNAPTITIQDDGAAYTLTNTISVGSKITVTASVAGVTNLNITKA